MGAIDTSFTPDLGRPSAAKAWLRALEMTAAIGRNPSRLLADVVDETAGRAATAPALIADRERFSYRELSRRSSQYARWAIAHGVGRGDRVCLLMPNRPEYMAIWLGVSRVGGVAALVNANLAGPSLAHSIDIVTPRHVIVAAELAQSFATARPHLRTAATIWSHGGSDDEARRVDLAADTLPGETLAPGERSPRHHRRSGAVHLHLRHHRPAEGGAGQSLSRDDVEQLVCRHDGHPRRRPHV